MRIDQPGGRLEFGENPYDALKREIAEEVGLEVEIVRPIHVWTYVKNTEEFQLVGINYLCAWTSGEVVLSEEHEKFVPLDFLRQSRKKEDDNRETVAWKHPAVVLIMGTGKTDRDGNEKSFKTDLYKNLANMFVESGFVCVRYDKRGTYQTEGNFNTEGLSDLVDDAISVIRYAKSLSYADEKYNCLRSQRGAMIATLLSAKEDTAGLLLLGGAATCMKDALLCQNHLAAEEFAKKSGYFC